MNDVNTLKQKAIDYMAGMDLSTLPMEGVSLYVSTVQMLNAMEKADYMDNMIKMISASGAFPAPQKEKEKEE